MPNPYFKFKQFTVFHDRCAMKVTTDACFFGAWCAEEISRLPLQHSRLLDIGAGSGLLSLMIAQKNFLEIEAVEIDPAAAKQATENVFSSPWPSTIKIINDDVRLLARKPYDLIVSNPPFYENELRSNLATKNTAHHSSELKMAEVVRILSDQLKENGTFFLLYPYKRSKEIEDLLATNDLHPATKISLRQSVRHPISRVMIMGTRTNRKEIVEDVISISDGKNYSPQFVSVLRDYYLDL